MDDPVRLPTDLTPLVLEGHVIDVLRTLPGDSVQVVVTSPPYWGLRAYGTEGQEWGGKEGHEHVWVSTNPRREREPDDAGGEIQKNHTGASYEAQGGAGCYCGAWKGELGAEPTPELYVSHLADVFDEVRRVLRPDGTLWLNLGDTYTTHPAGLLGEKRWKKSTLTTGRDVTGQEQSGVMDKRTGVLAEKNLVGIPWRVAFELQRRGWFLRSDVIWFKRNPMPESVTDRPTRSHEYIFELAKSGDTQYWTHRDHAGSRSQPPPDYRWIDHAKGLEFTEKPAEFSKEKIACWTCGGSGRIEDWVGSLPCRTCEGKGKALRWERINLWVGHDYFYDADAVRSQPAETTVDGKYARTTMIEVGKDYFGRGVKSYEGTGAQQPSDTKRRIVEGLRERIEAGLPTGANLKTVWDIPTQPYPEAHFATYPEEIPEWCIRLGTSEKGACGKCGAPWERSIETNHPGDSRGKREDVPKPAGASRVALPPNGEGPNPRITVGWSPTCSCPPADPVPCLVMDIFGGSGTTGYVARQLGRRSILIELNPSYVKLARDRSGANVPSLERFHEERGEEPEGAS
jgi:DNA modification methylase